MQVDNKIIPMYNAPLTFNNKVINGFWVESAAPITITAGWTTLTTGASRPSFDVAGGVSKSIHMQTTQLDGSYVSSYYAESVWSDQLPFYAPSAGIWNNEWLNYYDYSQYTDMSQNFSFENVQNTIGIYTMDFFDRTNIGAGGCPLRGGLANYIRFIPSSTTGIFHYSSLTSIDNLFNSCTAITGEIIPFITAMNALKPGISHTNCFYNCTNASDYAQVVSQYPDWL